MKRSISRWTTALATAAVLSLPAASLAQTPAEQQPTQPPSQPPTSQQPPASSTPAEQQVPSGEVDAEAAKQHLTAARNALSEMTQLPAASQLTGEARSHVSQLITNFNELITSKSNWKDAYDRVDTNLDTLIGSAATESGPPASGTEGAVGTSGAATLDPGIKAKLIEVRNHLDKFEQAAGGGTPSAAPSDSPAMSGAATGTTPPSPTTADPESEQTSAAQPADMNQQELLRHVEAIEAILNIQNPSATGTSGTTSPTTEPPTATSEAGVTLSASQVDQLRTHLLELKRMLNQR